MIESAVEREALIEGAFARMAKRRMTEIMGKSAGLREILVEAERTSERARNLGDLKGMGEAGAIVVAFVIDKNLRFVGEPPKRRGMDNAVAIAAEIIARRTRPLVMETAATCSRIRRERRPCPGETHCHVRTMLPPLLPRRGTRSAVDCIAACT